MRIKHPIRAGAMLAGLAVMAMMARTLVPELVRYIRIKTM